MEVDEAYENAEHKGNGRRGDVPTSRRGRAKSLGRPPKRRGRRRSRGRGLQAGRQPLLGMISRATHECVIQALPDVSFATLSSPLHRHLRRESRVFTDGYSSYVPLREEGYRHETVSHHGGEWVRGEAHTNTAENLWSFWRAFSRPHRGFSEEHLGEWSAWLAWLRSQWRPPQDRLTHLLHLLAYAPGRTLRSLLPQIAAEAPALAASPAAAKLS